MSQDEPEFLHGEREAERTKLQRAAIDGMHMSKSLGSRLGSQDALISRLPPFLDSTCVPPDLRHDMYVRLDITSGHDVFRARLGHCTVFDLIAQVSPAAAAVDARLLRRRCSSSDLLVQVAI